MKRYIRAKPSTPPKPALVLGEERLDAGQLTLVSCCYLAFPLGLGFLFPLLAAAILRGSGFVSRQLLTSALFCFCLWVIYLALGVQAFESFHADKNNFASVSQGWNGVAVGLNVGVFLLVGILLSTLKTKGSLQLPLLSGLAGQIQSFWAVKRLERAHQLNIFWPGLGVVYSKRGFFSYFLLFSSFFTALGLAALLLAKFDFERFQDLVLFVGFQLRLKPEIFASYAADWKWLSLLGVLILGHHFLAYLWVSHRLLDKQGRGVVSALSYSYLLHYGLICSVLLIPITFATAEIQQSITKRQAEIAQKLEAELAKQKALAKQKTSSESIPPPESQRELLMDFDLAVTDKIEGLNDFAAKPYAPEPEKPYKESAIGLGDSEKLPELEQYAKKYSRKTKSFSEYLTAKVREHGRDKRLWDSLDEPFSAVVRYRVLADGTVSKIELVESSGNTEHDALMLAVIESMNPLTKPPGGKSLQVTELFWSWDERDETGLQSSSSLQQQLVAYPDGRYIQEF